MSIEVDVTRTDEGVAVATVRGALDLAAAADVQRLLLDATPEGGVCLLVDLTEVDAVDAAGVGALLGAALHVQANAGNVVLCDPHDTVHRLLRLGGMDGALVVETDRAAAEARFSGAA